MTYTPNTPWVDGAAGGTPLSAARLNNLESGVNSLAYTTYTPTWTSNGSAPAIGNATVTAVYAQTGGLVHAFGQIVFGSSSTFGSGEYSFALPVQPALGIMCGVGYMATGSALMLGAVRVDTFSGNGTMKTRYGATYGGTPTYMGQLAPFTWATGHVFEWNITYKAN